MKYRRTGKVFYGRLTSDGAGVRLRRVFGNEEASLFDPFLLLDEFGSKNPEEYLPGFPTHPHRGIETVTYMLEGSVAHKDSLGNAGTIGPGDLQWMTAGGGILHEEMPQLSPDGIRGFQLWVNLPSKDKMREPRYRDAKALDVPVRAFPGGQAKVFSGVFGQTEGLFRDISGKPTYFDIRLDPDASLDLDAPSGETAFAYIFEGEAWNSADAGMGSDSKLHAAETCLLFGEGDSVSLQAGASGCRFIFARGMPLRESVAWGGPIVMNTRAELESAFRELELGTFVRKASRT